MTLNDVDVDVACAELEHKCSCTLAETRSLARELAELHSKQNADGLLLYLYATSIIFNSIEVIVLFSHISISEKNSKLH